MRLGEQVACLLLLVLYSQHKPMRSQSRCMKYSPTALAFRLAMSVRAFSLLQQPASCRQYLHNWLHSCKEDLLPTW